ncbi:glycoside hydrolase family 18 protein [Homoserinibacter sp. YIM 151385]|uniref:glycoside hydrolase family 18 protein n=1 Tax=Homoserinibacter sp. YIM 151385 TaxID=2985506 RepID=UPI0022F116E6|nr:glycosyl hydrolase family 18 protein [Homoserinibacter sp. YIM 151385]WBU37267.1 glycosyl hydrolase family 18 protein [Homoserinibacter sp. YIM 151385]
MKGKTMKSASTGRHAPEASRRRRIGGAIALATAALLALPLAPAIAQTGPATTAGAATATTAGATTTTATTTTTAAAAAADRKVVGYFAEWGVYNRNYDVKNIATSGSAEELTHILYAFGNVTNGACQIGESYPAYEKAHTAEESVDGVADTWDQELRGNFNQLRKLKAANPDLKVIWSFGGWSWSGGFGQAAQNPVAFAQSCRALVEDPRWADVFDGIDIDWEYPNACGLSCDTSGPDAYREVIKALRDEFGTDLVTSAITADGTDGGKMDLADYGGAAQYLDWIMPMTYDYYGAFAAQGPTAPHSPLTDFAGAPNPGFDSETAIAKLTSLGVPSEKILLGIGFYGRGWTGVTQEAPGGTATGPAPGQYEPGIEDYKVLKERCPATGEVGGTAYAFCDGQWWSYDTPETIAGKMSWAKDQGLGGAFFWELSGDTADGELVHAIGEGLR